jgi:protein-L-isoaspartate(D-aspartate) O-methyltransferase
MKKLVKSLVDAGTLRSESLISAFLEVDRAKFVPADQKKHAYEDRPLPIGFEQTISQPTTVAFMLELLAPLPGHRVLDVGSGSGWQTALLCKLVAPQGQVYAVERIKELLKFGRENVRRFGCRNVDFKLAGEKFGWPEKAPFDLIIAAAAASHPPQELLDQLKVGGRCVLPVRNSIFVFRRLDNEKFDSQEFRGFVFVPLLRY